MIISDASNFWDILFDVVALLVTLSVSVGLHFWLKYVLLTSVFPLIGQRCVQEFRTLLAEVLTSEAASQETEDGKTPINSWSTAKRLLKSDLRYSKVPRNEREGLWRRYAEDMLRRKKSANDSKEEKRTDARSKYSLESSKLPGESRRSLERR